MGSRRNLLRWDPAAAPGLLGKGWKLLLEARIDASTETVVLHDADGTKVTFTKQSDGAYSAPEGTPYKLSATTDGYRLTPNNEGPVRNFDRAGRLTTVVSRSGDGLHLAYAIFHMLTHGPSYRATNWPAGGSW
ncbi:hypothetical protein [Streptomyces sp. NPDC029674]|uniref:hypothetical protein n=1 Tax=Streptomyces sp. NPDC029674 TaxID=3365297 RepID=UPI00384D3A5B